MKFSEIIKPEAHVEFAKALLSERDRKAVDRFTLFLSRNPPPSTNGETVVLHKEDYDYAMGRTDGQ